VGRTNLVLGGSANTRPAATFRASSVQRTSSIDDDAAVGHSAFLYLNRKVGKLIVEVDAVSGHGPASTAVQTLRTRLESVVDKPGGTRFVFGRIASGHDSWTVDDLERAEKQSSRHHSDADTMVMHVLYVDGTFADASDAVGATFSASSAAIFKQQAQSASTPLVPPDAIEEAALVHEAGHLLSLVNIGYRSPRDHEDPQHRGHSSDRHSVMYWAIDRVDVVQLLGGSTRPSTEFVDDDLADLRDIRDGKLP